MRGFFLKRLINISWRFLRYAGVILKIDWPLFIKGTGSKYCSKKVLLYYKNESIVFPWLANSYSHSNLWEIREIVRILNQKGFLVDLIDRDAKEFIPDDVYDLFIGLGAGLSGKFFAKYAKSLPSATKILLAAGPEPRISNQLVREQYDRFNNRKKTAVPAMRLTEGLDFETFAALTDYFLVIGEPHTFCPQTYKALGKPVLTYLPSSSPKIRFDPKWIKARDRKSFLCFAGHGFICKGVDILVDAFTEMPNATLYICGPDSEKGFFDVMGDRIKNSGNISYEGFVEVGGKRFNELVAKCSFVIFASSSEGCATSVTTVLRAGLIPILTPECGIDVGNFGYLIDGPKEDLIAKTIERCKEAMNIDDATYRSKVWDTLKDSLKYTQESFSKTMESALIKVLEEKDIRSKN